MACAQAAKQQNCNSLRKFRIDLFFEGCYFFIWGEIVGARRASCSDLRRSCYEEKNFPDFVYRDATKRRFFSISYTGMLRREDFFRFRIPGCYEEKNFLDFVYRTCYEMKHFCSLRIFSVYEMKRFCSLRSIGVYENGIFSSLRSKACYENKHFSSLRSRSRTRHQSSKITDRTKSQ